MPTLGRMPSSSNEVDALLNLLDDCERGLAVAVAVSGGCLNDGELSAALGEPRERIRGALGVLRDLGWVRERPTGNPVIGHALLASRLRDLCPPDSLHRLQAAVARTVQVNSPAAALIAAYVEASRDATLALQGARIFLASCRACLFIGEVEEAASFLDRAEALLAIYERA